MGSREASRGSLTGVKVMDASAVTTVPVSATIVGTFDADVVKVEALGAGGFTRHGADEDEYQSLEWVLEVWIKRSITLDLHHHPEEEILKGTLRSHRCARHQLWISKTARRGYRPRDRLASIPRPKTEVHHRPRSNRTAQQPWRLRPGRECIHKPRRKWLSGEAARADQIGRHRLQRLLASLSSPWSLPPTTRPGQRRPTDRRLALYEAGFRVGAVPFCTVRPMALGASVVAASTPTLSQPLTL